MIDAAEVHGDEVAGFYDTLAGHAVGHAGVRAGDGDGVEAVALRAAAQHLIGELGGELAFRKAGLYHGQHGLERGLGDALRGDERVQLIAGLVRAQAVYDAVRADEGPAHRALERDEEHVRKPRLLRAYLAGYIPAYVADYRAERAFDGVLDHLHALMAAKARVLDVPRVGYEPGAAGRDYGRAVHGHIARGEEDVPVVEQEQGAELRALHGLLKPFKLCHGIPHFAFISHYPPLVSARHMSSGLIAAVSSASPELTLTRSTPSTAQKLSARQQSAALRRYPLSEA